jgi:O-antigen ligase
MRKLTQALLILFVFAIPWEYSLDLGAPFGNIARILGLVVLLFVPFAIMQTGTLHRPGAMVWLTAVLYLWFCCTFFWTSAPQETLTKLRGYPQEMMLIWLLPEFVECNKDVRGILRAWLAGSWILALLTFASFVWQDTAATDQIRFAAAGQDPNDTARFLVFGFPIAAILFDGNERRPGKFLAAGYLPVGLAGVLLTASRSGFLVALVALSGCTVLLARRHSRMLLAAALMLPPFAWLAWAWAPRGTLERIGTIAEQLQHGDLNQRVEIWRAGWQAFVRAPFCGHGAGSFAATAGLAPIDTAHNTILAIAVEGGLIALALAMAIVIVALAHIKTMRGSLRIGLGILMAVWLALSLVGTVGENRATWLLLGLIASCRRLAEESPVLSRDSAQTNPFCPPASMSASV